jgi:capsid protein
MLQMIADKFRQWRGATNFDYDGANTSDRRFAPTTRLKSTDQILTPTKRKRLTNAARDLQRNFSVAAWAIRRHLDYVSRFSFEPKTGDKGLDAELRALMEWFSRPYNCDVAGRHSLPSLIRMAEERRTVDGDCFLVKLSNGQLQAIESDRVRDPDKNTTNDWVHGIQVSPGGRSKRVAIWRRDGTGGYDFERSIDAKNVYHLAYYQRFDQIRGVSLLAPAINTLRDCYEAYDYALAKLKVSQMFGLVLSRESSGGFSDVTKDDDVTGGYKVDFGKGPVMLDLDPGDEASIIESKNPSNEFQNFSQTMVSLSLKSLDIPMSFFDESFTNFFGSRAAFIHYEKACSAKKAALSDLLDHITGWRMKLFIADGTLKLPGRMTLGDLNWEWVSDGTPWWNPLQEINADIAAINSGLKTRSMVVRERHGKEFRDVVDQLQDEQEYMAAAGIIVDMAGVPLDADEAGEEIQKQAIEIVEDDDEL